LEQAAMFVVDGDFAVEGKISGFSDGDTSCAFEVEMMSPV
jgi:hypothetical protein